MVVLDTDHLSLLEWENSPVAARLLDRLDEVPSDQIATTIVNYEEQIRGWTAYLARRRTLSHQIDAYRRLRRQLQNYCKILVLDFDDRAAVQFQTLMTARLRIGTMDLKVASVTLSNRGLLLSKNLADFRKIPGLKVEDWTL